MRAVELRILRGQLSEVPPDEEPVLHLELEDNEKVVALEFNLYPTSRKAPKPDHKTYYWSATVEKVL